MQKKHRLVLWIALGGIAFVAASVTLGALLFGIAAARQPADPLMREEVEEELARLPMKETEFFNRLRAKQSYFGDYGTGSPTARPPDTIERIFSIARGQGKKIYLLPGKAESDVVAISGVISWDGWSGGSQDVHVTEWWELLVDRDDYIIGYIVRG